uniref:formin-like protein 15 n=1 Tax=Erigeron canadensis TaxID=72917 RepID=UPI001CB9A296|nr:formin-like protein 15 [Erigeron canadensis]
MTPIIFILLLLLFIPHTTCHQPFFPVTDSPPPPITTTQPPSPSPSPQPQPQPKHPFSSLPPPFTTIHHHHFFPFFTSPPSPTTTPSTSLPTFPANLSSITIPPPSTKSHTSKKLFFLSLSLSLLSIIFITTIIVTLLYNRTHHHKPPPPPPPSSSDGHRLFPANHPVSDKPPPSLSPNYSTTHSSEYLYLGTLISPLHDYDQHNKTSNNNNNNVISGASTSSSLGFDTMGSPELHPLPPLPRHHHQHHDILHKDFHKTVVLPTRPPPPPPPMQAAPGLFDSRTKEEIIMPKLKPLHWDKLRASSEKATAWDQLKCSSFQLNEEMIETLFMANSSKVEPNYSTMASNMNQNNRVLDPHKSRNIAILLRAFNLTVDEVCECILQGYVDNLGSELLGSLLKMAPTMEEEVQLKELKDSSLAGLDHSEKFLKAVIDIPFAFKRVDAMLYISNFDTEIEFLKESLETIQSACQQLRSNRMLIKLLKAVLMAGNRMNIGTNRGDAHAFKLDTLLKLIDIKGTDGKTTLLHFVVQEITRAEGRLSEVNQQSELYDEVESKKRGLEMVSGLGGELSSVKKAASMDFSLLSKEVERLAMGLSKIRQVVALSEQFGSNKRFLDSMNMFLKKAEDDIVKIKGQERVSISMVKETTEYFHGNLTIEEGQPLWIFMVVRDFLLVLDRVCKEVGKMNERTTIGNQSQSLPSFFPSFNGRQGIGSFDGEDESTMG